MILLLQLLLFSNLFFSYIRYNIQYIYVYIYRYGHLFLINSSTSPDENLYFQPMVRKVVNRSCAGKFGVIRPGFRSHRPFILVTPPRKHAKNGGTDITCKKGTIQSSMAPAIGDFFPRFSPRCKGPSSDVCWFINPINHSYL